MAWILGLWTVAALGADGDLDALRYRNEALRNWLQLAQADSVYLVVDRQAEEVRLVHGRAVLRRCAIVVDRLGRQPGSTARLALRLRPYRAISPWSAPGAGPFDWEHNLVEEATPRCALYFANGVVLYAAEEWQEPTRRGAQLSVPDLRALYNTCAEGTPLVVLPAGWKEEG